jgi:hypothetical protein
VSSSAFLPFAQLTDRSRHPYFPERTTVAVMIIFANPVIFFIDRIHN